MGIGNAAEARFGILIETKSTGEQAFQSAIRHERELLVAIERLNVSSRQQAQDTRFLKEAFIGAAQEAKRLRDEEDRLRAEQERGAVTARKLAAEQSARQQAAQDTIKLSLGIAGAVAAGTAAVIAASKAAADYQEKLELVAENTGFTTAQIAAMRLMASESGRTFEQIEPALNVFVRRIGEAGQGNEDALRTFNALGIGVKNLDGTIRPTGDLFRAVQQGLREIESPAERARLATEFFGRSGTASIAILLKSIDAYTQKAQEMGIAGEGAGAAAAHAADTGFDRLAASIGAVTLQFQGAAAAMTGPFANALADVTEMYSKWLALQNQNRSGLSREGAENLARLAREGMPDSGVGGVKPSQSFLRLIEGPRERSNPFEQSMNLLTTNHEDVLKADREAAKSAKELAEANTKAWKATLDFADAMADFTAKHPLDKLKIRGAMTPEAYERQLRSQGGPSDDLSQKNLERFRQQEERDKKRMEEEKRRTQELIRSLIGTLSGAFSAFVQGAISDTRNLGQYWSSMIRSLMSHGLDFGFNTLFRVIAGAAAGGPAGAIAGGTGIFANEGAVVPSRGAVNLTVQVNIDKIDSGLNDPRAVQELANKMAPALGKTLRYNLARAS